MGPDRRKNRLEPIGLDWIVHCFTSLPAQYRLYDPTNSIKVLKEKLQRKT